MGILFVLAILTSPTFIGLVVSCIVIALVVAIALYDFDHHLIPHELVWPFNLIALGSLFITGDLSFSIPHTADLLAGPLLASFFWIIWMVSRGKWMGFADGTLALGIGWWLGIEKGITALLLSFWSGALISLFIMAWVKLSSQEKRIGFKSEVPFGPFLILGFILVWVFNINLVSWYL